MKIETILNKLDTVAEISKSVSIVVLLQVLVSISGSSFLAYILFTKFFSTSNFSYLAISILCVALCLPSLLQFFIYYNIRSLIELPNTFREMLASGKASVEDIAEVQNADMVKKSSMFGFVRKIFDIRSILYEIKDIAKTGYIFVRVLNPFVWILFFLSIPLGYFYWFINFVLVILF